MQAALETDPFGPFGVHGLLHAHLIGSVVGGYQIAALLGEGGQGAVYLGVRGGQKFAVKVWGPTPRALDSELLRLRRESSIAVELSHPSLVQVHEAGWDEGLGLYFVAMEYVREAGSLREVHFGPILVARVMSEVLEALSVLHSAGLLHRDLKPSNVLIDAEGRARLADLGLVADLFPIRADRSGTIRFMAPESLDDGMICDPRSEVYAAGAMLYELLTGALPWKEQDPFPLRDEIQATRVLRVPGAPRPLAHIVIKAMDPDPARRYQSASEMRADLQRFASGAPVHAQRPPLAPRLRALACSPLAVILTAALLTLAAGWATVSAGEAHARERDARALELELMQDRAVTRQRVRSLFPDEPVYTQETPDGHDHDSDVHDR